MNLCKLHASVLRALAAPVVNHVLTIDSDQAALTVDVSLFPKMPDRCMGRLVEEGRAESAWDFWNAELVYILEKCTNSCCDFVVASRAIEFAETPLPEIDAWVRRARKSMFFVLSADSPWRAHVVLNDSRWMRVHKELDSPNCEIFFLESDFGHALAVAFVSEGDEQIAQALIWANECWVSSDRLGAVFVDCYSSAVLWLDQDVTHDCMSRLALKGIDVFCVAAPAYELEAVNHVTLQRNKEGVIEFSVRAGKTSGVVQFRLSDGSRFCFDVAEIPFQSTLTSAVSGCLLQVTRQGKIPLEENEWWFRIAMLPHEDIISWVHINFVGMEGHRFLLSSGIMCDGTAVRLNEYVRSNDPVYFEFDGKGKYCGIDVERLKFSLDFHDY